MSVFEIRKGSIYPPFAAQLVGSNGKPISLVGASAVYLRVAVTLETAEESLLLNKQLTIANAAQAKVKGLWSEGETDLAPGDYQAQVEAILPSGPFKAGEIFTFRITPNVMQ